MRLSIHVPETNSLVQFSLHGDQAFSIDKIDMIFFFSFIFVRPFIFRGKHLANKNHEGSQGWWQFIVQRGIMEDGKWPQTAQVDNSQEIQIREDFLYVIFF